MNIKAISFKDFLKNKKNLYKNINAAAKRARQINDFNYEKIAALQNIEDSDQLEELVIEEESSKDKSITIAMDEFLNDKLDVKEIEDSKNEEEWPKYIFRTI